ncbi:UbiH/UbiF family hydroxylase [Sulfurisoma sediminicola]|uniref:2-octaprenyl-3-methyl-6-methoxy-1,4-benzoquinol hydroxylase n=1 Tax=Sulfurisoma sediminicola TaxID=1381557 RepID=A0A497XJ11_9PROT|nr:UbiH/UbiF family hydroxylase [Sulfurisoma sediminicola]RLJ67893.1 2-octaprenyl-3-methyl-6-methoxy-1,4-benzoquinol hydroxylase [Sulfurisoma sediminicola]
MQTTLAFDIVIVGGGLAGLALATALRKTSYSIAVVEGRAPTKPEGWDARIYAISPGNTRFLEGSGIWNHLDPARMQAVETMEVFGDAGGHMRFSAYDSGIGELAWIVESSLLQRELWETARRQGNVTLFCPAQPEALAFGADAASLRLADGRTLQAQLVVAADGADSWTRSAAGIEVQFQPYGQHGVVANFRCEMPHRGTAFQWFRHDGVLAWLPLPGNLISMVWSTAEDHARELVALPAAELCARVADAGALRLGRLELVTPAAGFPLRLMRAPRTVAPRLALVGDAAHAIHPLSGHGINLGFQDARALAETLAAKPEHIGCGDVQWLRRYERARREEVVALQSVTDGLQRLFGASAAPLAALRNAGLNLTGHLPVLRDALVRYAIG